MLGSGGPRPATPWLATFQRRFATKHPSQRADMLPPVPFIGEPRKKDFHEAGSMLNVSALAQLWVFWANVKKPAPCRAGFGGSEEQPITRENQSS
jgi:hypothetical protein